VVVGGVIAALLGALVLAFGAQFQSRGVQAVDADEQGGSDSGSAPQRVLALVRKPGWLGGSSLLVLAIVLQLVGLLLAPLPVVQPLGVLSLVVTALLGRRLNHARIGRRGIQGVAACVVGITVFVVTAAFTTSSSPDGDAAVVPVLLLLGAVLAVVVAGYLVARTRLPAVAFAVSGGVCFGFVATLMKIVLDRCGTALQHGGLIGPTTLFTLVVLVCAGLAGLIGISLVQRAYSAGSPDLVVAALTVVDPLIAVSVGIGLLGQARSAPLWAFAIFAVAEALAVFGVVLMARNPPKPVDDASDGARSAHPSGAR
jgi:drug/metabolite transporter (DMT)-like permease